MIQFPKFEDFNQDQQDFIRSTVGQFTRFEEKKANLTEADFEKVFGQQDGQRHWSAWKSSDNSFWNYAKANFNQQEKDNMLAFLKS